MRVNKNNCLRVLDELEQTGLKEAMERKKITYKLELCDDYSTASFKYPTGGVDLLGHIEKERVVVFAIKTIRKIFGITSKDLDLIMEGEYRGLL